MKRIALLLFTIAGLSAADAMTVDPSGKVGIGTSTPFGKLSLYTELDTRPANVDTPRLIQTWQAAGTANYAYDTRWDLVIGNNGAVSGTGTERARNKLIFQSRTSADSWSSSTNAFELRGDGSAIFAGTVTATNLATLVNGKVPLEQLPTLTSTDNSASLATQFSTIGTATYVVPSGVTRLTVTIIGAGGGGAGGSSGGPPDGGYGANGGLSSVTGLFGALVAGGGTGGTVWAGSWGAATVAGGTFSGPGLATPIRPLPLFPGISVAYPGAVGTAATGGSALDPGLGLGVNGGACGVPARGAISYGGGGGGATAGAGSGGGAGATIRATVVVNPGETLTIVVGAGGLGGYPDNSGNNFADRAPAFTNGSANGNGGGGGGGDGLVVISR